MLRKLIALSVVFGLVLADPITRIPRETDVNALDFIEDRSDDQLISLLPDKVQLAFDVLKTVIGFKASAVSLAVCAIEWLVSNGVVIVIGALTALGFCKLTGKCSLNYDEYVPVAQLRSLATPEYLDTAQRFLVTAVEKYAEKRGRTAKKARMN